MERLFMKDLVAWKRNPERMPMLVFGARQVGKSTTIYEFAKNNYANVVLCNLDNNEPLQKIFDKDLNPQRIILELEALTGQTISKGATLVFFDEIQDCPKAIASLKYFCEQANEYHIIGAGSLLGVAVNRKAKTKQGEKIVEKGVSYPVGKANVLNVYPMTFQEFLLAVNPQLIPVIKKCFDDNERMPESLHDKALELYRAYLFTGGMPKAVYVYETKNDHDFIRFSQNEILGMYYSDFGKYSTPSEVVKIREIYNSIPAQLAKENKKIQYRMVGSSARASAYEAGLHWLTNAGLVIKCFTVNEGKYPLAAYQDMLSYKIYMNDVGLLNAKSNIARGRILAEDMSDEARGSMAENFVAQELLANGLTPYYWESNGKAEVDFVTIINEQTIPIEVKSKVNTQSKSLKVYVEKYKPKYAIRISQKNFGLENNIKSVPLYAVWRIGAV